MSKFIIPEYFNRSCSRWNVKDFLEEYEDKDDLSEKLGIYLRSLETIADNEEGQRSKRAKELLLKYREVNVLFLVKKYIERKSLVACARSRGFRTFKSRGRATKVVLRSRLKADPNNRPDRQKVRNLNSGRMSGNPSISINNSTVSGNVQGIVSKRKVISNALDQKNIQAKKQRLPYVEQNIEDEYDEKGFPLSFESSQLLSLQEMISETIKSSEGLDIKLLKWQQHTLQQLSNGIGYPSKQNIHNILGASSIFYFQQKNEQSYGDFLASDELLAIWSRVKSKFKKLAIPEEIIEFVKERKKSFQQDSLETIERSLRQNSTALSGDLLTRAFFKLLEECILWEFSTNVDELTEGTFVTDFIAPLFNKTVHYFNYTTSHSWIDVESKASKLRRGYGRCPDYKLNNKDGTRTGVLAEVTSPKRKNDESKIYWDIYRGAINAKDEIDQDIKQNEICPDEAKRIIIFIVGFKMSVCILDLLSPGIYILAEVDSLIIPKTVRNPESIMKLYQILMSIRDNAVDILGDRSCTTPLQTNYSTWLRPTAITPNKTYN
ncbi:7059_t:CDS:2 [Scutellospora calospora]|uniref:7059_t:CDS:1 n=1 Tax=Scutellospora calospora TaxID=85575 RepID=A0ACA9L0I6_9GLOM|nr:7059_t:CDS:2 [Scutellospora calospora]